MFIVNKKLFADVKGKRIYVCCPGCIDTIRKDPEKYIKQLEKEGVTLETVETADAKEAKAKCGSSQKSHTGHKCK